MLLPPLCCLPSLSRCHLFIICSGFFIGYVQLRIFNRKNAWISCEPRHHLAPVEFLGWDCASPTYGSIASRGWLHQIAVIAAPVNNENHHEANREKSELNRSQATSIRPSRQYIIVSSLELLLYVYSSATCTLDSRLRVPVAAIIEQ